MRKINPNSNAWILCILFLDTFKLYEKGSEDSFVLDMDYEFVMGDSSATELRFSTGTAALTDIDDLFDANNPFLIIKATEDATNPTLCLRGSGDYTTCDPANDRVYFDPSMTLSCVFCVYKEKMYSVTLANVFVQ